MKCKNSSAAGIRTANQAGWKMKIGYGTVICVVQFLAIVAVTVVAYGLPDLAVSPGSSNLQPPVTIESFVKNIGTTTPNKDVKVKLELRFAKCNGGQVADQKKIIKIKTIKKKKLEPGESVNVTFGPFLNGLFGTWLFAGFVVTVDPSNAIVEGAPGFEDNNGYGILAYIMCSAEPVLLETASGSKRSFSSPESYQMPSSEITQLRLFDAAGRQVLERAGAAASVEELASPANGRLANGVYLYIATVSQNGQREQKMGKIAVLQGKATVVPDSRGNVIPTAPNPPGGTISARPPKCNGIPATIVGTSGNDTIVGTEGKDVIVGLGGNDWIHGLGGDDLICGGNGNDLIVGGKGNDTILGGMGHDTIDGSEGDDNLHGNDGVDQMTGGVGNDLLRGGAGDDLLLGDAGYDYLNGGPGKDQLDGGSDLDTCVYGEQTFNCP